jgi:hypothetical protein
MRSGSTAATQRPAAQWQSAYQMSNGTQKIACATDLWLVGKTVQMRRQSFTDAVNKHRDIQHVAH